MESADHHHQMNSLRLSFQEFTEAVGRLQRIIGITGNLQGLKERRELQRFYVRYPCYSNGN